MTTDRASCRSSVFLGHGTFQEAHAEVKPRLEQVAFLFDLRLDPVSATLTSWGVPQVTTCGSAVVYLHVYLYVDIWASV